MIIEIKYHGVASTYNKFWRGRKRTIEQLFDTWE
jgi:hypothetical protein